MIIRNEWIGFTEVTVFEWIDGENYYLHLDDYDPGASLSRPPRRELSMLLKKDEYNEVLLRTRLNSLVKGLVSQQRFAKHWQYN